MHRGDDDDEHPCLQQRQARHPNESAIASDDGDEHPNESAIASDDDDEHPNESATANDDDAS
jgi:hypothetical protein